MASDRLMRLLGAGADLRGDGFIDLGGADMGRSTRGVFGIEIVELISRDDLDDRQRGGVSIADNADGELSCFAVFFNENLIVMLVGLLDGLFDRSSAFLDIQTDGAAFL